MRSIALATILLFGAAVAAMGQIPAPPIPGAPDSNDSMISGDAAVTYQWIRSNAQPGGCGCIDLNGLGISGSWNVRPRLAIVTEVSGGFAGKLPSTGNSLTMASFLAGARYSLPQPWMRKPHSVQPFVQLLVGAGHAGGGFAGAGDGTFAFATRMGGGIDLPVHRHLAIRLVQIDYDLTHFPNSVNDHQNNLLLGSGIVYRWSHGE